MNSQLTRRAAAKAFAFAPFAAVRGTAANNAVTVGLIGSGNRGTFVAGMLAKNTPGRVVAVCDLFEEKMQQAAKSIGVQDAAMYTDLHKLLASPVDAVYPGDYTGLPR